MHFLTQSHFHISAREQHLVFWVARKCILLMANPSQTQKQRFTVKLQQNVFRAKNWWVSTYIIKNSKWVWSGNTTITNCSQTHVIVRKSHTAITRHQEDIQSKATSSLFPIEMIAKLEWTQSNAQQNIEQLQNPTMGVAINNESTTI